MWAAPGSETGAAASSSNPRQRLNLHVQLTLFQASFTLHFRTELDCSNCRRSRIPTEPSSSNHRNWPQVDLHVLRYRFFHVIHFSSDLLQDLFVSASCCMLIISRQPAQSFPKKLCLRRNCGLPRLFLAGFSKILRLLEVFFDLCRKKKEPYLPNTSQHSRHWMQDAFSVSAEHVASCLVAVRKPKKLPWCHPRKKWSQSITDFHPDIELCVTMVTHHLLPVSSLPLLLFIAIFWVVAHAAIYWKFWSSWSCSMNFQKDRMSESTGSVCTFKNILHLDRC